MDFQLNEEQKMLKKMVHDLAEKEFRPKAAEWEAKGEHMPRKYLTMLADLGLLGLCLPTKYGGQGKTAFEAILAIEELARISSLCAAPVFESNVGPVKVVEQFGTEEQKQKYLPPVCRGESLISIGMTEPEAGSALTDLATRAVLDGDHYVVNGQKRFCTGGGESDAYMVYVRLSEQKGAKGIGGLLIEKGTPGFSFGKQEQLMGLRGIPSCDLIFDNCRVPKENLVVREGEFRKLMTAFDLERCGNATMCLGIAQGAFEEARAYALQRKQWGKEICEFQAIQFMLADIALRVEAARLLIYRATTNAATGLPVPLEANLAKCFANQMVREVTGMALQIHGGYGYSKDYPVERMMRDGWGWGLAGGTIEIQKITLASFLLGRRFDQRR
ncbi:MAG: acyl-CoA dehydrogenase [Chloroflexi bacterium]|nr:acyl-CoA dehydrogenase [Chloroflexota bacterium]MBM3173426.1 acyl-CoA dehydrogenase [Chloroflexota bacterium]MBM3176029.1 acyl-CoA dehydrogenase [Chloroflexota bacterium]MBM4449531.1 acyl-CoA dehydrogenase [Chloroflexota bacterium]